MGRYPKNIHERNLRVVCANKKGNFTTIIIKEKKYVHASNIPCLLLTVSFGSKEIPDYLREQVQSGNCIEWC